MIDKIKNFMSRNVCESCDYYNPSTGICQSKKVATCGCHPYVNWLDRKFCEPYKADRGEEE